jgi:hypothetical protein
MAKLEDIMPGREVVGDQDKKLRWEGLKGRLGGDDKTKLAQIGWELVDRGGRVRQEFLPLSTYTSHLSVPTGPRVVGYRYLLKEG